MKTLKMALIMMFVLGVVASGYAFSAKNTSPGWDMKQGSVTPYQKGHEVRVSYTPELIQNYDKQHMPWFASTLKPEHLRR